MSRLIVHQFHHSTAPADAVTNQMFFLRRALAEAGIDGDVFSVESRLPEGQGKIFSAEAVAGASLLLVHHSQGNPALEAVLSSSPPKALVYHNITPSEFFPHDPYLAALSRLGREQLIALRRVTCASFADSAYNAFELETLGFGRSERLPLLDLEKPTAPPAEELAARAHRSGPILFVGRLAPHKNQALLLKTYAYLKRSWKSAPPLTLVGGGDPIYRDYLKSLARVLGIERETEFLGKVSEAELRRQYETAGAFVCLSLHEGFCIPLVEAMQARVPIVALPIAAVKETLGNAGVQLSTRRPHRIAEILKPVLADAQIRRAILRGQQTQLAKLWRTQDPERGKTLVRDLLQRLGRTVDGPKWEAHGDVARSKKTGPTGERPTTL